METKEINVKKGVQTTVIKTQNITKVYNHRVVPVYALNGIDLEIKQGEFTAIVGPSGCGKTTLLNIIGGLDAVLEQLVFIDNTEITSLRENKLIDFRLHNIGFVFQAYNLIRVLTAWDTTAFIMQLQKRSAKEIKDRVDSLLKEVGLEDKLNKRPNQLSGGQQQRVAVARALASKPKFILADEPTANLDSSSTNNLLDIMLRLNEEEGITFVFSTHDQRVINKAKRIITLDDGKVVNDESR